MRKFISILLVISMVFGLVPVPFVGIGIKEAKATGSNIQLVEYKTILNGRDIHTSLLLNNGNIFFAGSLGEWEIINPDGITINAGNWNQRTRSGASRNADILVSTLLDNGNIYVGGETGIVGMFTPTGGLIDIEYSMISTSGNIQTVNSFPGTNGEKFYVHQNSYQGDKGGSVRLSTGVGCSVRLDNGNIFLGGPNGKYYIVRTGVTFPTSPVVKEGTLSITSNSASRMSNGDLLLSGSDKWEILSQSGNNIASKAIRSWSHGSSKKIFCSKELSDGNILLVGEGWELVTKEGISVAKGNHSGYLRTIVETNDGKVLIGGEHGKLYILTDAPVLDSISVTPASLNMAAGRKEQLVVIANISDGTQSDVTNSASYSSNKTSIATVSSTGLVTAVGQGTATITVSYEDKQVAVPVTVTAPVTESLQANPSSLSLAKGMTDQVTITAIMSDGTQSNVTNSASYSSSNPSVSTATNGVVTAVSQGTATITASYEGKNVSIPVTVTAPVPKTDSNGNYITRNFQYSPNPVNIEVGQSVPITVTKLEIQMTDDSWQDISSQVTLSAPAQSYITLSENTVTGQSAGSTTINVLYNGKITGTIPVTVTDSTPVPKTDENGNYIYRLEYSPTSIKLAKGQTHSITVTKVEIELTNGSWQDVTNQTDLETSNPGIASLSGNLVTGVSQGSTSILIKYNDKVAGTIPVTVTEAVPETDSSGNYIYSPTTSITPNSITLAVGNTATVNVNKVEIKLTDGSYLDVTDDVTLHVDNPNIASLTGNTVTGVSAGSTNIVAKYNGKPVKTIPVTITAPVPVTDGSGNYIINLNYSPASISIYEGETETIIIHTAAIQLTDGSWQDISGSITMRVGNSTIAGLSENVVTGKKAGSTTITLRYNGKPLASIPVKVQAVPVVTTGITVTPAQVNVKQNQTQQLTVKATLSNGTTKTVTAQASYSSHDTEIATVTASGKVKGIAAGSTIITVSYDGYTVDVPVTVTENSAGSPNVSTKDRTGGGSSSAPVVNTRDRGTGSGGSGSSTPPVNRKDRGSSSGTGVSAPVVSRPDNRGNEVINQKERPENGGTPVVNKKTR